MHKRPPRDGWLGAVARQRFRGGCPCRPQDQGHHVAHGSRLLGARLCRQAVAEMSIVGRGVGIVNVAAPATADVSPAV